MTSPSPLKSLHKLVRLLGWTSPFFNAWQTQKTESVRNWLSLRTHVQAEAYRQRSIKAKHVSLLCTQLN